MAIYERPAELLQRLIQFDTTNPPGNEGPCIRYARDLLAEAGIDSTLLGLTDERPNLVARLRGRGESPPLLLYGHVDVVTTAGQQWTRPPFAGEIVDGYLWGRGAIDMKGGVAMFLSAFLRARAEGADLPGDVILVLLADEEIEGKYGAKYLVEEHPGLFEGVRYALGEFGSFTMYLAGQTFYPIMVSEKQCCWLKATVHGPGGHASMPIHGGATAKLATLLQRLDRRLPVHVTPPARLMIEAIADHLPFPQGLALRGLLFPPLTNRILDALGEEGHLLDALLHNTVSPTVLHGSTSTNVIPAEVTVEIDGRILPGYSPDDLFREMRTALGPLADDVTFDILSFDPGPGDIDMALFDTLADILHTADPAGIPIPYMLAGVTDGRIFAQIGIQTYGFTPMKLAPDFSFTELIHAADERVPVESIDWGAARVYEALQRF
jgi:acetylornithine deacetylase/succinyl-diaminopimelate desuccinylase-like protein